MPVWLFATAYGAAILVTLAAGIWLLLHLTAVAQTFAGMADIVPSSKPARASRRAVRRVLAVFGAGFGLTVAMQIVAMSGVADAWIG